MKNILKTAFVLAVLVVGISVGYYRGLILGSDTNNNKKDSFISKNQLEKTGIIPEKVTEIEGEVLSVDGDEVRFLVDSLNPLIAPELKERILVLDDKTNIILYKEKSPKDLLRDMESVKDIKEELNDQKKALNPRIKKCEQRAVIAGLDPVMDMAEISDECRQVAAEQSSLTEKEQTITEKSSNFNITQNNNASVIEPGLRIKIISKLLETKKGDKTLVEPEDISNKERFGAEVVEIRKYNDNRTKEEIDQKTGEVVLP